MSTLAIQPADRSTWRSLEDLFEEAASTNGCWCMWPRVPRGSHKEDKDANKARLKQLIALGEIPGLVALLDGQAVGWVSISAADRLARIQPLGDSDCWVIACLYVSNAARCKGVVDGLLSAAINFARDGGASTIEAIPAGWRAEGQEGGPLLAAAMRRAGFEAVDPSTEGVWYRLHQCFLPSGPKLRD